PPVFDAFMYAKSMLFTSVWLKVAISHHSQSSVMLVSGVTCPDAESTRISPTTGTTLSRGGVALLGTLPMDRSEYCHHTAPRVSLCCTVSRSTDASGSVKPATLKDRRQVVGRAISASIARAVKFCG